MTGSGVRSSNKASNRKVQPYDDQPLPKGFQQVGPHEPITIRIKNILKDYKEGLGIFKEIIQNADDAGASKVRFLIDWRHGPKKNLLSPKMVECQGPALWAYNNAVFTDQDFKNINKLAGATKVNDLAKIGRFGLGFNAVYHVTDVPSFVSREYFVIFDPNVNHLQNQIKDRSRPGISINLDESPEHLSTYEGQFKPYHNVFGCQTCSMDGKKFYFDGTLFRFPFRTKSQAIESEISKNVYDESKINAITSSLKECASLLLLFTQHVTTVELYEAKESDDIEKLQPLLSVAKPTPQIIRSKASIVSVPFIKECSDWWKKMLASPKCRAASPSRCELVTIDTTAFAEESAKREFWLVTSCVGTESSVQLAYEEGRNDGLLPCAGAAAKLQVLTTGEPEESSKLHVTPLVSGEAFCFLPLSIPTGLPVHVNGYFALSSNRMGIWERDTSSRRQPVEVLWNECLMQDALANAYIQLLEDMKSLSECGYLKHYDFHAIWPSYDNLHSTIWGRLVKSFYDKLVAKALPLLCSEGTWLSIQSGYVLSQSLLAVPEVVDVMRQVGQAALVLPLKVTKSLEKSGQNVVLKQKTLTVENFFRMFFIPNISKISRFQREAIVCFALSYIFQEKGGIVEKLLKNSRCITVSSDGRHLAKPCDLINPHGSAAKLFSEADHRFPVGECFLGVNQMFILKRLGMKDLLSWHGILERAKLVENLVDFVRGKEIARNLIMYLKKNIEKLPRPRENEVSILRRIKFLPIMSVPPSEYFLPWKGCMIKAGLAAEDLFLATEAKLVGSVSLIIDETDVSGCGTLGRNLKELLGFSERRPPVEAIIQQLDTAVDAWTRLNHAQKEHKENYLKSVCKKIYKYFEDYVTTTLKKKKLRNAISDQHLDEIALERLVDELAKKRWLFIRGEFVMSESVAYNWNGHAMPFLFELPQEYREFDNLLNVVELKQSFDESDFIKALYALEEMKAGLTLTDKELKVAVCLLSEIKDIEKEHVRAHVGRIPLPDLNKFLRRGDQLTVNLNFLLGDQNLLEDDEDVKYVHPLVHPPQLALDLGAKSVDDRRLEPYSCTIGRRFGQHENLIDRLANILKGYPCDAGILKELVQNADDAQATEIHFIHDTRTLSRQGVFLRNAEEVQGPALCVYNNRPFSKEDLEGIQKLGVGSKRDDLEKTGQYGIGFNAVYHLTDCPSLLSNGNTLCFFDPQCRYVPGATRTSPGREFQANKLRKKYPNLLAGYLGDHLILKDSTVFRLPLRTQDRSLESPIAKTDATKAISKLFTSFERDAKKMLLFLNYVKKIRLSVVEKTGKLVHKYEATSKLNEEDEKRRQMLSSQMNKHKDKPTSDVPWEGKTYAMTVSDSNNVKQKWLVHQCCGVGHPGKNNDIPDGRKYGFSPRGGVAALVSTDIQHHLQYVAYCFLPLPSSYTSLPVHVNGHFALDTSRRNLWRDETPNGILSRWNDFIKSSVLAPGYASLIMEAKKYITNFTAIDDCWLSWYHNLFPNLLHVKDEWKILAIEVYHILGIAQAAVLPMVVAKEDQDPKVSTKKIQSWLTPQTSFFKDETHNHDMLWRLLLRIHLPLSLHSPQFIHLGFKESKINSRQINPKSVIEFLRTFNAQTSSCIIGRLPTNLEDTKVKSRSELRELMNYCMKDQNFSRVISGLPLLLTADGKLRVFDNNNPVYLSKFSDLFPTKACLFVHPYIVKELSRHEESLSQVMRKLTVRAVSQFLPSVFPQYVRGATKHVQWIFADKGVLSKGWFQRLWEFLQNHIEPSENELQVSLEALHEWPVIPTTCGKLVTIALAKTVLDQTERGTETARVKKVRNILAQVKCPTLNTAITLGKSNESLHAGIKSWLFSFYKSVHHAKNPEETTMSSTPRKLAVTDPFVAHPHSVADVLQVLDYMMKSGILNLSMFSDRDFFVLLQFFQDEYENLQPKHKYDEILRNLPLYKTFAGTHVNLSAYSSYAIVPRGVPLIEIGELQRHTECLFLHFDALPTLQILYEGLGTGATRSVSEFYIEFILPFFHVFPRDCQLELLSHIKDKVLPICLLREDLLRSLRETHCIPDERENLHRADEFLDPQNDVFQVMLDKDSDQFPPSPFKEYAWLDFLKLIGLTKEVTEIKFLQFCREVESRYLDRSIIGPASHKLNVERSKALVKYLFTSHHLHSPTFLNTVSTVNFVASEKVEEDLLTIHSQYQCKAEQLTPFVQFCSSIPWDKRNLVWSNALLLPSWVKYELQKTIGKKKKIKLTLGSCLGVEDDPSEDVVMGHLRNISSAVIRNSQKRSLPNPNMVGKVLKSIYGFLSERLSCSSRNDLSLHCSSTCTKIGRCLQEFPCVFIEEDKTFVRGEQLSFLIPCKNNLSPFLYTVPREYGCYQHFFKRLGATETVSSHQVVNALQAMKEECKEERMTSYFEEKTRISMYLLFELIVDNQRESKKCYSSDLFLPSEDRFLVKSDQLVCRVPPHLENQVAQLECQVLLRLETCGLSRERETDYLDALPEHLRPRPLYHLIREELDPSCKNNTCHDGTNCSFIKSYVDIMKSEEFHAGILRLMKHQKKSSNLSDDTIEKCLRLRWLSSSRGKMTCMDKIKIHLVDKNNGNVLKGSSNEHDCYAVKENNSWVLYVLHGTRRLGILSKCVNEIMDGCFDNNSITVLADMLSCESPSEITELLNEHDIAVEASGESVTSAVSDLKRATEMIKSLKQQESDQRPELLDGSGGSNGSGGSTKSGAAADRGGSTGRGGSAGRGGSGGCVGYPDGAGSIGQGGGVGGGRSLTSGSGHYVIRIRYLPPVDHYTVPNHFEAQRWMAQSRCDLKAAEFLLASNRSFNALVCFLSHQIAEKSLKAALYAKKGLTVEQLCTHNVRQLASDASSDMEITRNITMLANRVGDYYLPTRYPNRQPEGRVPAEEFDQEEAKAALDATKKLVELVENFYFVKIS